MTENRNSYKLNSDIHNYDTRTTNLRVPLTRLNHSRDSTNYYGPLFYDEL